MGYQCKLTKLGILNEMQKIIEIELSKREYQILHEKFYQIKLMCSDESIDDTAKVLLYKELVSTLMDIRNYEINMFFIKFGLIY